MAVRIRMKQMGRKHRLYYRIVAVDARSPRDGRVIEELGSYDPHVAQKDARVTLVPDRIKYWISVGAQPSDTMHNMLISAGITTGKKINVLPTMVVAPVVAEPAPATSSATETEVVETTPEVAAVVSE